MNNEHFPDHPAVSSLREGRSRTAVDYRYLRMAHIWAENSYCKRRQVGALVVKNKMIISDGYNGTPSGFEKLVSPSLMFSMLRPMPLRNLHGAVTTVRDRRSM